jgi:phosphoribosylformylglycinamidine synthase
LKEAGNVLFIVGSTADELGGSHWHLVTEKSGGNVPKLDAAIAKKTFYALHGAIDTGLVRACHDLSEGGLATALAEMAFAGGLGAYIGVDAMPNAIAIKTEALLFGESNTRFICEVRKENALAFLDALADVPVGLVGVVEAEQRLKINRDATRLIDIDLATLKAAWLRTLDW